MKLNFKIDFFYYQRIVTLDGDGDPKELELFKDKGIFKNFINTEELFQVIGLLVKVL